MESNPVVHGLLHVAVTVWTPRGRWDVIPRGGIFWGAGVKAHLMSCQVLSVLESARLSGLIYKVLSEHGVCRIQRPVYCFEFELLCLFSLSVSPSPSPSLSFCVSMICLLYSLCFT